MTLGQPGGSILILGILAWTPLMAQGGVEGGLSLHVWRLDNISDPGPSFALGHAGHIGRRSVEGYLVERIALASVPETDATPGIFWVGIDLLVTPFAARAPAFRVTPRLLLSMGGIHSRRQAVEAPSPWRWLFGVGGGLDLETPSWFVLRLTWRWDYVYSNGGFGGTGQSSFPRGEIGLVVRD